MFRGIHHTSVVVGDMERSIRFYCDLLGLRLETDKILEGPFISTVLGYPECRARWVTLDAGDDVARIELLQLLEPRATGAAPPLARVGASHVGLIVDDIQADFERLRGQGVRFKSPPQESGGLWAVHFYDPDGISLELIQLPSPAGG